MRQVALNWDGEQDDICALQALLDEVTLLGQEALQELSAHELREDRAAD